MDIPRPNPHQPSLRFGTPGPQPIASRQLVGVNLVLARFDVDGHELALVFGLQARADIIFVDGVAAPRELLFAVAAFRRGHERSSGSLSRRRWITLAHIVLAFSSDAAWTSCERAC